MTADDVAVDYGLSTSMTKLFLEHFTALLQLPQKSCMCCRDQSKMAPCSDTLTKTWPGVFRSKRLSHSWRGGKQAQKWISFAV